MSFMLIPSVQAIAVLASLLFSALTNSFTVFIGLSSKKILYIIRTAAIIQTITATPIILPFLAAAAVLPAA